VTFIKKAADCYFVKSDGFWWAGHQADRVGSVGGQSYVHFFRDIECLYNYIERIGLCHCRLIIVRENSG